MKKMLKIFVAPLGIILFAASSQVIAGSEPQVREIQVTARRYEFAPKTITLRKGEPVRLLVTSEDVDHGIEIAELGVDVVIKARQTKTIELAPDREGRFEMVCSVFCGDGHPDMVGEIIVTSQNDVVSGIKVTFDETMPGVVFVESNGERIRIDTSTKSVARMDDPLAPQAPKNDPSLTQPTESASRRASEPYDYHVVNIPTPKRVPRGSLNLYFTHRFEQPVRPLRNSDDDLLGLDSFSVSSFGVIYGITDRLYANFYRSPLRSFAISRTIEIGLGYHLLDEAGGSPVALSAYSSVEGDDNFKRNFTYNFQAMVGRSVSRFATVFFSPAVHINTNGNGRFNPRAEDFGEVARDFELGTHTGSFGFGINGRVRETVSLVFDYTPRIGFKLGRIFPIFDAGQSQIVGFENRSEAALGFGIEKRVGRHVFTLTFSNTQATTTSRYNSSNQVLPPSRFAIGFNLFRRLR